MSAKEHFTYSPPTVVQSFRTLRSQLQQETSTPSSSTTTKPVSPPKLIAAAVQLETKPNTTSFYERATAAVKKAVTEHSATLVLLQELFLGPYFCQSQDASLFETAEDFGDSVIIRQLAQLAKEYRVVLPLSLFERRNNAYYNSIVMIDADGANLGVYRKSHIPDGTGYQEKFYFTPGDTGFKVFHTKVGTVGVGICWDQWFPECARAMALLGADVLLYPTAIGSEPQDASLDSSQHWHRVMQGHAAANMVPVVASNRYGTEILLEADGTTEKQRIKFYGKSFITDETGGIIKEAKDGDDIITAEIDIVKNRATRHAWGLFRDRRPELYSVLKTKDGVVEM